MPERSGVTYRLAPAAERDLEAIFDYTVREWGLRQAEHYAAVIENACARLAEAPELAQDCGYIRAGYRRAAVGRHVLYFRVEEWGIAVVRILHQRMDVERHV